MAHARQTLHHKVNLLHVVHTAETLKAYVLIFLIISMNYFHLSPEWCERKREISELCVVRGAKRMTESAKPSDATGRVVKETVKQ